MHKDTILGFLRVFARFARELRSHGSKAGVICFSYSGGLASLQVAESVFRRVFARWRTEYAEGKTWLVYYLDGLKITALKSEGACDEQSDNGQNR